MKERDSHSHGKRGGKKKMKVTCSGALERKGVGHQGEMSGHFQQLERQHISLSFT